MDNKGSVIVGYFLSGIAGMFLMYAINKAQGPSIGPEKADSAESAKADVGDSPIPVGADDASWGNADALVTIVEISDFQCPFCSRVGDTLAKIKETYGPEKIRLVWKHNPLPFHKQATPAHEASQAVFGLGGSEAFWKFHDSAFANQKALTPENFEKWAVEAGVDAAKFKAELKNPKYAQKIKDDLEANRKIGATGTPAFRINGITLAGAQPFPKFKEAIDKELQEAEKLIKAGTPKNQVSVARTKENFKNAPAPDKGKDEGKPKEDDNTVWRVPVLKEDPVKGAKDALVTIVEWSDYQCPFCTRVEPTIKQILDKYPKDVRVIWKDNALPFHKQAKPAAGLARAAYEQGGDALYWKAHEALFAAQKDFKDDATFTKIGKDLGLSDAAIKEAVGGKYDKFVEASMELASELNARGTPHFFINGRRLSGAQPFEKFDELVASQKKIAEALVAKGVARDKVYDEIMKTAKGPAAPEKRDVAAPTNANPAKGAKNAKVVIQEFSDFQCPYCTRVGPTLQQVMKEFGDDVQIVWRNMPLPFHKEAKLAAEAAQEVFVQQGSDGFWKYHDKLFENQKAMMRPDLEKYAEEIGGINMARFKKALDDHTHQAHVEADMEIAKKAGVRGTPAFTVNGYFLSGAQPYPQFQKMIKLALSEAGK
jgi:protein-disulfide isomerase